MARLLTCGYETGSIDEDNGSGLGSGTGSAAPVLVTATPAPRSGTYSIKCVPGTTQTSYSLRNINLPAATQELFFRVPFFIANGAGPNIEAPIIQLLDSAGVGQVYFTINFNTGVVRAYRGATFTGTQLGSTTPVALLNAWNALEFRLKVAESPDGILTVWLNEVEVLTFTGDTAATANLNILTLILGIRNNGSVSVGPGAYSVYDDIAVNDTTGGVQDGRTGDAAVLYLPGNADGNSEGAGTAWDGSDGNQVDNWVQTDEVPPATADYNTSADVNDIDSFGCADVPAPYTAVTLVQPVAYAALAAAGEGDIRTGVRSSATDYPDAADRPLTTTYQMIHGDVLYLDPAGGAWDTTKVNALEVLVKVV